MNTRTRTILLSIGLAGAGVAASGGLVSAQYAGDGDTATTPVVAGLQADGADTDADADEPACRPRPPRGNPEVVAEALGVTTDELRAARDEGLSVAEYAEQLGVDLDTVVDAVLADIEEHLAEEVAAGDITQEDADARLENATERVAERLASTPGERPERGERPPRPGDERPADETPAVDAGS